MVREPVERVISMFYYIRSHMRWSRKRWKGKKNVPPASWFEKTFDDCVLTNDPECHLEMKGQLTFFCGKWTECRNTSSPASLQLAKYNVETQYSVVGVMERFNTSLRVMEMLVPRWFQGATQLNTAEKVNSNSYDRVGDRVREVARKRMKNELEFYSFINQRLSLQERK